MSARRRRAATSRWAVRALFLALAVAVGCEFLIDVDELGDQKCPANQKPCPTLKRCVSTSDPETGCSGASCAPCPVPAHVSGRCAGNPGGEVCMTSGCIPPYDNCDKTKPDCETDLAHSPENCGSCGNQCATENGFPGCSEGNCRTGGCRVGFGDCDGQNGCEADFSTSGLHCGGCGQPCTNGTTCMQGSCQ